jgi:hypothetical protein
MNPLSGMRKCNTSISFFLIVMLPVFFPPEANGSPVLSIEQHFIIRKDYVYVLPHSSLIQKIHKNSGDIVWKTQVMSQRYGYDGMARQVGSYSKPLFEDDVLYAVEHLESQLLGVTCASGRVELQKPFVFICLPADGAFGFLLGHLMLCDELLMIFSDQGAKAMDLQDPDTIKWEFSCDRQDLYRLVASFHAGDSLFLFASGPQNGISWENAYRNWSLQEYELVELNCATGEVINRYGKDVFFGNKNVERWGVEELGKWQGSTLLLVEAGAMNYSLFKMDPMSKSMTALIERLNDIRGTKGAWLDSELKPVLLGDSIFHNLDNRADILLIGRSLLDGKILLNVVAEKGEKLYAGAEAQLFSLIHEGNRFTVTCRSAATGEICWKRKIRRKNRSWQAEMKTSDGCVYLLTDGYMRALDATNGKLLWEVPLYPEESLWSRILGFFD